MKPVKILAAALGFGLIVALAGSFMPPAASASGAAPVMVLNTPLPVQGSVSVSNFPAVQAVSNTNQSPLFVQNVENPARTGFQVSATCTFDPVGQCMPSPPIYTVPAGKIAVLEYASGECVVDSGTTIAEVNVEWIQGPALTFFHLVPEQAISTVGGEAVVNFGRQVRSYAFGGPSGNPLLFKAISNVTESGQGDGCGLSLAGYTINQ